MKGAIDLALGGGTFTVQNKLLPGAYINFVSASHASAELSDRGTAALPMVLDWGSEGEVFTVTAEEFQRESLRIFGYPYTAPEMKGLRDFFLGAKTGHFYRLNGGSKASCTLADARYSGTRGNALKIVVEAGEGENQEAPVYDVSIYMEGTLAASQKGVRTIADLTDNDFVSWKSGASLSLTAGMSLAGGTTAEVQESAWQTALEKLESMSFNTLGCLSADGTVKALFAAYTKRMRDENGVKFQTVLHQYAAADYEGVISVENGLSGAESDPSLVYWVTGAEAGCAVNAALTNSLYTGEFIPDTDYTQTALGNAIRAGKFIFHRVGTQVRILSDINTFTSVTEGKTADFSDNQVIRVLDQIGNDIAVLFNTRYTGKVPNDNAGRISFWKDICRHHEQMQDIRAIQDFDSANVSVKQGDSKKSVLVTDFVTPTCAMTQLYMTVTVS